MTKEFLTGLGLTEDVIAKIQEESGKDIEREKAKYADRDTLKQNLADATKELEAFKALKPEDMQKQITELSEKLKTQEADSAKRIAEMETQAKVKDYLSEKKFVNSITKDAIAGKLAEALNGDESKGKSLDDIFGGLIKDQKNILLDENKPAPPTVPNMAQTGAERKDDDVARTREIMGLPPLK